MQIELDFKDLSKKDFLSKIAERDTLALVEFKADWSGGSHMLDPIIRKLAFTYNNYLSFFRIDADTHEDVVTAFGVDCYPTLLFFSRGEVVDKISGIRSMDEIIGKIEKLIKNDHETTN